MTYPKQVALITHRSDDDRQIKRLTFNTMGEHKQYIQALPFNQQLIEDENEALDIALSFVSSSDLLRYKICN
jgi:hypothetical protein